MCQTNLENMLHQGSDFYQRLIDHLTNLKQNVKDFKMSRFMQMEEMCKKLGVEPPKIDDKPPQSVQSNLNFEFF